ncbi:MAG: STAS domain-containing protein [Planctomycetaceae bacterium]
MNFPRPPLDLTVTPQATVAHFRKAQILDQATLNACRAQLDENLVLTKSPRLILDLSELTSVSSAALGWLVLLAKERDQGGVELILCGLSPVVRQVFEMTRLTSRFRIASDVAAALSQID